MSSPRHVQFFGFDWSFALTDSPDFPSPTAPWRSVQLPHDWSCDYPLEESAPSCGSGGYARCGIGWYQKHFHAAPAPGRRVYLLFEGVYMHCDVYVNGQRIGGHAYGYTSFTLECTKALRTGDNELLIRVDNSHQPGSRWYSGSGITRDVYLVETSDTHVDFSGICVRARVQGPMAEVTLDTDLCLKDAGPALTLKTRIISPAGDCVAEITSPVTGSTVHQRTTLDSFDVWSLENPALYTASVDLMRGETVLDTDDTRFGIRNIAFTPQDGFLLNDQKVILQGVCLHHDGGCLGAAVPREVWKRRLSRLQDMGCNALRCAHNPPDPALLDLADEMGFLVMDEAFDEWQAMKSKEVGANTHQSRGYSEWFDSCWREDITSMIRRDRNHPSIIMWSIGNEIFEQVSSDGHLVARALAGLCHALDPTRPVTAACDQEKAEPQATRDAFLKELDIVGVNYPDRWRERTETMLLEEKLEHPERLYLGTEDVAVNGPRGDVRLKTEESIWGPTSYYAHMLKAEKLWKFMRTSRFMIGDFMWTGIDYLGECFWPNRASSAGVLDLCAYPKDGFYFYQSQWRKDMPVLYLHPHRNLPLEKGDIYPQIVYTNCFSVELLVGNRSWGVKAYEFPFQGMTQRWGHFDRPLSPVTTGDLHLSWDIPFGDEEVTAIGRDQEGHEIIRRTLRRTGPADHLQVTPDLPCIPRDGRSIAQLEIALMDRSDQVVPDDDREFEISVKGGELLGVENGRVDDLTPARAPVHATFCGLALAIVRSRREDGPIRVTLRAKGLPEVTAVVQCITV